MEFRCPQHDVIFQTETDHTRPGTRLVSDDPKLNGKHRHPQYAGGVSGHPDCPLCQKEAKAAAKAAEASAALNA